MADVINRTTKQYLKSVNTPDYPETEWIHNPILPEADSSEWIIDGDSVRETTQSEKDAKIAEEELKKQEMKTKEAANKLKANADRLQEREAFMGLSTEEKLIFLYNSLHEA